MGPVLDGKAALVTGAARGMGAAAARLFVAECLARLRAGGVRTFAIGGNHEIMHLIEDGRYEQVGTFKPEPKRWVIERTFAWFGRNRRLAKDFEQTITSAEAWFLIASVRLLSRRLARA